MSRSEHDANEDMAIYAAQKRYEHRKQRLERDIDTIRVMIWLVAAAAIIAFVYTVVR